METTFFDLNDDCIASILIYLPAGDYMHFGQVCSRFRNVLHFYGASLYKRLELVDSNQDLLLLRKAGRHVKTLFLSHQEESTDKPVSRVAETISGLANLERATLKYGSGLSFSVFKCIIRALEKLPKMESVGVIQGVADRMLYVDHYIDCDHLILNFKKYAKDRALRADLFKIGILSFGNASIEKGLAEMVPHLPMVEDLGLRFNRPPREYLPITQIPRLLKMSMFRRQVSEGSLMPFLSALASAHSNNLLLLVIGVKGLGHDEVKEIARISSLQDLDLYYFKPEYIYHLTALKNLVRLSFTSSHENIQSSQLLAVIQACKKLAVLYIGNVVSEDFICRAFQVLQNTRDSLNPEPLFLILAFGQLYEKVQDMGVERYIRIFSSY